MLDFKYLRDHIDQVKEKIAQRGTSIDWETFFELDASRRELLQEVENLRFQRNTASEKIAELKKNKKDAAQEIENMRLVSQSIKELESICRNIGMNVLSIDELRKMAMKEVDEEMSPKTGDDVIALIEYIDGTALDKVMEVIL